MAGWFTIETRKPAPHGSYLWGLGNRRLKIMKVIAYSDLHLHNYKQHDVDGSRLRNCSEAVQWIYDYAYRHGINLIFFPGDWYDSQEALPTEAVDESVRLWTMFKRTYPGIITVGVSGNHDHAKKNLYHKPAVTALSHLQKVAPKNFVLLDRANKPFETEIGHIWGIPYFEYPEHYLMRLKEVSELAARYTKETGEPAYLQIHQTPQGIANEAIPFDTKPSDKLYRPFTHVFCGHIHTHQLLTDHFTVVGSPLHRDLGDAGEKKGFLIYDTDTNIVKRVLLKGFPEYTPVTLHAGEEVPQDDKNYIVPQYVVDKELLAQDANTEDFNTGLSESELVTNYFNEVNGQDKALLKVGLALIN